MDAVDGICLTCSHIGNYSVVGRPFGAEGEEALPMPVVFEPPIFHLEHARLAISLDKEDQ